MPNTAKMQQVFNETLEKFQNSEKNYIRMTAGIVYDRELQVTDQTAARLKKQFEEALAEV